jgi:hypothetical protein
MAHSHAQNIFLVSRSVINTFNFNLNAYGMSGPEGGQKYLHYSLQFLINIKHLPHSLFTGQFFVDDDSLFWCIFL